ncbi:HAF repeat-containing protein [bacterium]|nr:HAF repeat-containing protein [bacterium]
MKRTLSLVVSFGFAMSSMVQANADEPKPPIYRVVPEKDRHKIVAIGLNSAGDLLAFRWTPENGDENVLEQAPMLFEAKTAKETRIPLLKGYTATLPAALSDTRVVIGRASRPSVNNAGQRLPFPGVAFVWDEKSGIRSLGALPDDAMSHADSISADGNLVTGISIGPNRVRACVWQRKGETWEIRPLPQETMHLNSQKIAISPNGKYAVGVDGRKPTLWTRGNDGEWTRETIGDTDSMITRAVNDNAFVAGFRFEQDARTSRNALIWSRETGMKVIERPKGYVYAELNAINNRNVAVGFVDGPHGSEIGPNACVTENGRLRIFAEHPEFSSATAIDDKGNIAGTFEEKEPGEIDAEIEPPAKNRILPKN